ncbi:hypothetical protein MPNT_270019 [Candidatus Methylacidithermus pantelleriae]|uniref:Uncharacterized protein n=1 Tax=Candidatus Methylacidithermus pantelleriae TaxID=2744239 RepID=A0A8J2BTQ0_9BACT|nr:hypothetical protein MPNT_270019 [Candidatus Methylacidithermus pantelleriae]
MEKDPRLKGSQSESVLRELVCLFPFFGALAAGDGGLFPRLVHVFPKALEKVHRRLSIPWSECLVRIVAQRPTNYPRKEQERGQVGVKEKATMSAKEEQEKVANVRSRPSKQR